MQHKIGIVTDSTADFPLSYYEENAVSMVPLTVRFGNESYKDWVEMPPDEFYSRLRSADELPKTSQPSVQEFVDVYDSLKDCEHIISVHISSKLSGTYQAASIAAQSSAVPVTVIDSKLTTGGLGLILEELVKIRNGGGSADEMIAAADKIINMCVVVFYVDTLKYLEMGGRIGKASAIAGSLLDIKPILTFEDGMVAPLKKAKGRKKAIRDIVEFVREKSGGKEINAAIISADCPELAGYFETKLADAGVVFKSALRLQLGCVVGTYAGPDMVAILFYPAH